MGKLKNRPPEVCAYRHCYNVFRPKREVQRFCSQRCRDAYRYDIKRAEKGVKKARKRHLGSALPARAEKGGKTLIKTVSYKSGIPLEKRCGVEVPTTTDIDDDELRRIIRLERGER